MKKLIAANWKMNKGNEEAMPLISELKGMILGHSAEILVCPPFTVLHEVKLALEGSGIKLGAQNMHFEDSGAYTGEISPAMLKSAGCEYVIIGHSERREFFSEDDLFINKKIHAALKHGLKPILCIGETLEQKEKKWTEEVIEKQLNNGLSGVAPEQMKNITLAYEPVWAISRGNPNVKAATAQDAQKAHHFIRSILHVIFGEKTAHSTRILYGGSMKSENAKELLSLKGIDGGLVGNASLSAKSFAEIVMAAH